MQNQFACIVGVDDLQRISFDFARLGVRDRRWVVYLDAVEWIGFRKVNHGRHGTTAVGDIAPDRGSGVSQGQITGTKRPRAPSRPRKLLIPLQAGVAKLADAQDLKSWDPQGSCGFDSHLRHQVTRWFCFNV